jgi:hypothetical protein
MVSSMDRVQQQARVAKVDRKGDKKGTKPTAKADAPKAEEKPADSTVEPEENIPKVVLTTFKYLNAATPRTSDLGTLTTKLIGEELLPVATQRQAGLRMSQVDWGEVVGVAGAWIAFFLGLATLRFVTRSY